MKKYGMLVVLLVIAAVAGLLWSLTPGVSEVAGQGADMRACTMEAMLCPDGSYVGRTGPNCEFAACPGATGGGAAGGGSGEEIPTSIITSTSTTSTNPNSLAIGQHAAINGVTIGVLALVEDSRCPMDVQCIQAGTVRVRTSIDAMNRDFTFTLGQAQQVVTTTGTSTITLAAVAPGEKRSTVTVPPSGYRFTFTVKR